MSWLAGESKGEVLIGNLTLTLPIRLAMDDATNTDAAAMMLVVKNMEPSSPSGRSNLRLKKYVIQDLPGLAC